MKIILTPIDFSRSTREVLAEALELARGVHGCIVLMHSVAPRSIPHTAVPPFAARDYDGSTEREERAARHLRRIQRLLEQRGANVATVCTSGVPTASILTQARKLPADVIVMGSHWHSALHELVIGSTTRGVVQRARCPVLIVPPPVETHPSAPRRPAFDLQFDPTR